MSCTCNKSINCEPCAFCAPPGVTCLPDCNPPDPCSEKIDLCCVTYSGEDHECSNITNGEALCNIILQILPILFPPDYCCALTGYISLSAKNESTTTTTTVPPSSFCYTASVTGGDGECIIEWINSDGVQHSFTIDDTKVQSISFCAQENTPNIVSCTGVQTAEITGGTIVCTTDQDCAVTTTTTVNPYLDKNMCFTIGATSQGLTCDITTVADIPAGVYDGYVYYELACSFMCPLGPSSRTVYIIYSLANSRWEAWDTFDPSSGPSGTLLASLVNELGYPQMMTNSWDKYVLNFTMISSVDIDNIGGGCVYISKSASLEYSINTCSSIGGFQIQVVNDIVYASSNPDSYVDTYSGDIYPGYLLEITGTTGNLGFTNITILENGTAIFNTTYGLNSVILPGAINVFMSNSDYTVLISEDCP